MPTSPNYAIAALAASQRAQRAPAMRPFRANAGGPFLKPRSFDPGTPSLRADDAARDAVQRAKRDADAVRASYSSFRNRCGTFY